MIRVCVAILRDPSGSGKQLWLRKPRYQRQWQYQPPWITHVTKRPSPGVHKHLAGFALMDQPFADETT